MQVGVRSTHGLVKTKILYILPDIPFVQSRSALGMVVFWTSIKTPKVHSH